VSGLLNWIRARSLQVLGLVVILDVVAASWLAPTDAFRTDITYRSAIRSEQLSVSRFISGEGGGVPIFTNPEVDGAMRMYATDSWRSLVVSAWTSTT